MKTEVKNTPDKGRGVFACQNISEGEVFEKAPVLVLKQGESTLIEQTVLERYYFLWGDKKDDYGAIVLGNGMLYNHSYEPNSFYVRDFENKVMCYKALRDISAGEEITINYNGIPDSKDPVWFDVK